MDYLSVNMPGGRTLRREIGSQGLTIGRSSQNDLPLLDDPGVSRVHARIEPLHQGYFLLDQGGKNGTYVNDRRITEPTLLRDGDVIRLGSTTLVLNGTPASRVEFVDEPLVEGSATTFISAEELRSTPPGGGIRLDLDARRSEPGGRVTPSGPGREPTTLPPGSAALLSIIFEADKELVFHRPLDEILEMIIDLVRKAIPFDRGLLMLLEGDRLVPRVVRVPKEAQGSTIAISQTIADRVVKRQESVLTADALSDERFRSGQSVVAQQIRSAMCVPLWDNREVRGLIYIDSRRMSGLFTEDHLRLLTHFANVAAVKIENARLFSQVVAAERLAKELEGASEIQNSLLPAESPPIPGYLLHGASIPCRAVGGDLYDFIELPGGRLAVALGDVAGKGFSAALLMCAFQASLRALSELDLPPSEAMVRLNRLLCRRLPMNRFVTFFFSLLDPRTHRFTYVNAGHCHPWLIRPGKGPAERLPGTGRPLGFFEDSDYEPRTIELGPGEIVVCFSDGVPDGVGPDGVEFGEQRLADIVQSVEDRDPEEILRRVMAEIESHHAGLAHEDDITLVVLKRDA